MDTDELLRRAAEVLDDGALGALLRVVTEMVHPHEPRRGVLRLVGACSLEPRLLSSAELLEALGPVRPKGKRLLRLAFFHARVPSAAVRSIEALHATGVLSLGAPKTAAALHVGMGGWRVEVQGELVGRLAGGCSTFSAAGALLKSLHDAPHGLTPSAFAEMCGIAVARPDVRDLSGDARALVEALPLGLARNAVEAALGEGSSEDSDADSRGDLAGFVVASDEDEEGSEGEGEGGGGGSDGSSSSSVVPLTAVRHSGMAGNNVLGRAAKRPRS